MHKYKHWLAGGLAIDSTGHPSAPAPAPSRPPAQPAGFQWDDAGIGAAGTVLLLGAGAMTAGLARRKRAGHHAVSG
jgi:hypothetical protein